jgi:aminoglycoside phosphotransferase (APT) family kinase protein
MNEPILKLHWERFKAHVDLDMKTATQLLSPYCIDAIDELTLLSEGCANTNYKLTFKNNRTPIVLRIYMREQSALRREAEIYKLLENKIPVPNHYFADDSCQRYPHPYALIEWIDGKLMREVILSKNEQAICECAFEAGKYLNHLRQIKFDRGGFFDKNLNVRPFAEEEKYLPFVLNLLQDQIVKDSLGSELLNDVSSLVEKNAILLMDVDNANLTHGDYDPANIIDWEFAFSGTYLLDIGLMLRYSHKLPKYYEERFVAGLESSGHRLPKTWKKQAKLKDLLCLLQLIHYNPYTEKPNLNRDAVSLIANIIKDWNTY